MKNNLTAVLAIALASSISIHIASCGATTQAEEKNEPLQTNCPPIEPGQDIYGIRNMLLERAEAELYIKAYENGLLKKDPGMTNYIWFDKRAFQWLGQVLCQDESGIDGIRAHFIEYPALGAPNSRIGRTTRPQLGVIFVPTRKKEVAWDAFDDYLKKVKDAARALNHGELCPTNCCDMPGYPPCRP